MAKRRKKYKVGIDSETYAISLVMDPAIEEDFIYMSEQEPVKIQMASDEKHMLYGAVLVPDKPIYRISEDGEEYYLQFTAESIEKMSQDFMKEYRQHNMTLNHEEDATEVYVVESWIKEDLYKDKSVALGLNEQLPVGTWFIGTKINNVETWEKVKNGELKGFSVESMIQLEDFSKISDDKKDSENMIDLSEVTAKDFIDKVKSLIADAWNSKEEEVVEDTVNVAMEETPTVTETVAETVVEAPEEPIAPEVVEQPKVEEIAAPVANEEPKVDAHLEELIKNLTAEIAALKEANNGLTEKVKEMSHEPSAKPITVNGKPNGGGDAYQQWRSTMKEMLGR